MFFAILSDFFREVGIGKVRYSMEVNFFNVYIFNHLNHSNKNKELFIKNVFFYKCYKSFL